MIKNKNQLKIRLKEDKESLLFETIRNDVKPQLVGTKRKANKIQTNAFTLLTTKENGEIIDSWIYYDQNIEIKNNIITYFDINGQPFIQIRIIELETITKRKWQELHRDYKEIIDGIPYILKLENGGTCLVPIRLED